MIAWYYGASSPEIYKMHFRQEHMSFSEFEKVQAKLLPAEKDNFVFEVMDAYFRYSLPRMTQLIYQDYAYLKARKNLLPNQRAVYPDHEISIQLIKEGLKKEGRSCHGLKAKESPTHE